MSTSSFDNDLRRLRCDWDSCVVALPSMLRVAADELPGKLRLKKGASQADWIGQFTPLVLLYPQYQAEGFPEVPSEKCLRANVAHLHLLIYAFLEDRLRDGQVELTASELHFVDRMRRDGQSLLDGLGAPDPWVRSALRDLQDDFSQSHVLRYTASSAPSSRMRRSSIITIASQKASYGVLASFALLHTHGIRRGDLRKMKNAFDCLVTGLQWLDDLDDWQEDLLNGDDNLLVFTLGIGGCHIDPSLVYSQQQAALGHAIVRKGMVDYAIGQANRYMEAAARKQRELGCVRLAALIEKRITLLPLLRTKALRELEKLPL